MNEIKESTATINEGKESGTIIHGVRGTVTVMNEVMESTTMNELKESPAITNEVKESSTVMNRVKGLITIANEVNE